MIEYAGQEGGRYTYIDDILNLQNLALAFNSLFAGCDNFIISGCEVSGTTISEGYVYINGKIRFFAGAKNISTFPVYIYESNAIQNVAYADAADKIGRNIYSCAIATKIPAVNDSITGKIPQGIAITATSALRLNDAFFGKYALMVNSPRSVQSVEKDVTFNGAVSLKSGVSLNGTGQLVNGSSVFSVSYDSSGNLTMQSQLSGKSTYKFIISSTGEFKFYVGTTLCVTIDSTGIQLNSNKITANLVQGGNMVVSGSEIYNKGVASDNGVVNVNYVGYNGGTSYYRSFNVYDGKNNLLFQIDGANKRATVNGTMLLTDNKVGGLLLKNTNFAKTSLELQKLIYWQDKYNENIAFMGYDSTADSIFRFKNIIGNIEIVPTEYFNVTGNIREKGVSLEQKYLTIVNANTALGKKADASIVYSKADADVKFVSLSGGISSIMDYMKSKGDADAAGTIRKLIGVPTTEDTDKLYVSKSKYLSDIATDINKQRQICDNIGAAYGDDIQKKLKDTGWVTCSGSGANGLYARQIGNIVCIQGYIKTIHSGTVFSVPNSIDTPHAAVYWCYSHCNTHNWRGAIEGGSRNFNVTYCNGSCGNNTQISITYMV